MTVEKSEAQKAAKQVARPEKKAEAKPEPKKAAPLPEKKPEPKTETPKTETPTAAKPETPTAEAKPEQPGKAATKKGEEKPEAEKGEKKAKKKKEEEKPKVTLERVYVIPLRDAKKVPRNRRANRGVKIVRSFITRHMKAGEVKIDPEVSEYVWGHGISNIPSKVRVKAAKAGETVSVSLAK